MKNPDQLDADKDGLGDACACDNPIVACANGMAGPFPCLGVDLVGRVSLADMGARSGNAVWGGVESTNGREIGVAGLDNGTAFIDLSKPACPVVLGVLPSTTGRSVSRDVDVMGDYAVVTAEIQNHGLQIFDMKTLPMAASMEPLKATVTYKGTTDAPISNAHNVASHLATNMIYVVGARSCEGGLHMVDMKDPMNPKFVGCVSDSGYVHDVECTIYKGPDTEHAGKEICFTFNGGNNFSIVDVTDKAAPKRLSNTEYMNGAYCHNGYFTEDQGYLLVSDELDEGRANNKTRSYMFDIRDLDAPKFIKIWDNTTNATDHNLYIVGNYAYEANYSAGFHLIDVTQIAKGELKETGFLDTMPMADDANMRGAWTAYPFFKSGIVIMQTTESGFFVMKPQASALGKPQ